MDPDEDKKGVDNKKDETAKMQDGEGAKEESKKPCYGGVLLELMHSCAADLLLGNANHVLDAMERQHIERVCSVDVKEQKAFKVPVDKKDNVVEEA